MSCTTVSRFIQIAFRTNFSSTNNYRTKSGEAGEAKTTPRIGCINKLQNTRSLTFWRYIHVLEIVLPTQVARRFLALSLPGSLEPYRDNLEEPHQYVHLRMAHCVCLLK